MSVPVERIRDVIAELEYFQKLLRPNVSMHLEINHAYYDSGADHAYKRSISLLQKVVNEHVREP